MNIDGLDTLVFSGGGVRGLAFIGCLMAFQDTYKRTVSEHFSTFAGTSVGALFALIAATGVPLMESLSVFQSVGLEQVFSRDPTCLLMNYALNTGENLELLVKEALARGQCDTTTTFHDLWLRTQKRLVITVVDLNTSATLYLDHTNSGRDMPILKAIMGSMALPPMFPPVAYNGLLMTDGGILDNFPISLFEPSKTLGLRTHWYIQPNNPMSDVSTYFTRVLAILQLTMHSLQNKAAEAYPYNVYVDLGPMKADNADVNVQDILFKGYRTAIGRFTSTEASRPTEWPTMLLSKEPIPLPAYILQLHHLWQKSNM